MFKVRSATKADARAIAEIYNSGITERVATFETRLRTTEDVESWFDEPHPVVVTCDDEGAVRGFASCSGYRNRECYRHIAEFSVYVAPSQRGLGLGRLALEGLVVKATELGYLKLISRIFVENVASRGLVKRLGFREVGIYNRHAKLDGDWRDVVIVELLLGEAKQ